MIVMINSVFFQNVDMVLDEGMVKGNLLVRDGKIVSVSKDSSMEIPKDVTCISGEGFILAPGFIDLHCHGAAGGDVNDGEENAYFKMEEFHRTHGTTSFMPSLSVDPLDKLDCACNMVRSLKKSNVHGKAEILGVHFESPYINPIYKGCQALERILPFDQNAKDFIEKHQDIISRITIAPELEGVLEWIPRLCDMGIIVSGGHSASDAITFRKAADNGMTMTTHLYNAMSSAHKEGPFRKCGVLEAALTDDRLYTELIADGFHVPPELLQVAWRCKGPEKFMLCSDASRAAGFTGKSSLFICGQEAIVENGVAMLKDRSSLASSAVALDSMVRTLVYKVGIPVDAAIKAASTIPAKVAGISDKKGKLSAEYDADLVLLNKNLEVQHVWCRGIVSC
jgi:N-acetylglucosamine-6-phosphate deacetylase